MECRHPAELRPLGTSTQGGAKLVTQTLLTPTHSSILRLIMPLGFPPFRMARLHLDCNRFAHPRLPLLPLLKLIYVSRRRLAPVLSTPCMSATSLFSGGSNKRPARVSEKVSWPLTL